MSDDDNAPRVINDAGLALIKADEEFRAKPYLDRKGQGAVWTIGYGHTHGVTADTLPITEPEACELLRQDLAEFGGYVEDAIEVDLNDNQFAALVSLTENCGTAPLHSGLGELLNAGEYEDAANHFLLWNKEHIDGKLVEVGGLTTRRKAERALFLTPVEEPATLEQ
jgi:lysozyme